MILTGRRFSELTVSVRNKRLDVILLGSLITMMSVIFRGFRYLFLDKGKSLKHGTYYSTSVKLKITLYKRS